MKKFIILCVIIGIADSAYLTYEHYSGVIPPCTVNRFMSIFTDCGKVLQSSYSVLFGIPLALLGLIHYSFLGILMALARVTKRHTWNILFVLEALAGAFASLYFMYLQIGVIGSICLYCTASALTSFILLFLSLHVYETERKQISTYVIGLLYKKILKPIFFLIDPEFIHETMLKVGEIMGKVDFIRVMTAYIFNFDNNILSQKIAGISFQRPVGLAAGFDYEAKLMHILPSIGFGYETVGTITNMAYEGNTKPRLGRLPRSKSLMVNKGFKNEGGRSISGKTALTSFTIPIGISIGRSNSKKLKTQIESIRDIVSTFRTFEQSSAEHSYYELNISCPNLKGDISFYPPKNLKDLLVEIEKLQINKPIFIKMPIEKTDREVRAMLDVVIKYNSIKGVIFGNLQKNRKDPALSTFEVAKFKVGYFSGKPTEKRSNELIRLAYKNYGKELIIIGCGGIFSAQDAYNKIKLGASLVQLITGMIFEGPQLVSQINLELIDLLKKDGFKNISEAVGIEN